LATLSTHLLAILTTLVVEVDMGESNAMLAPSEYAIPHLYALHSVDDFYRAFWVAEGNGLDTYDRQTAEQFFLDSLGHQAAYIYHDLKSGLYQFDAGALQQLNESTTTPVYSSPEDAIDVLAQAQANFYQEITGEPHPDIATALGYIYAYQFAKKAEANDGILPAYAYENFDPYFKTNQLLDEHGGESNLLARVQSSLAWMIIYAPDKYWEHLEFAGSAKQMSETEIIDMLANRLGADATLEDWIAYANQLSQDYITWAATMDETNNRYTPDAWAEATTAGSLAEAYEAAAAWDILRQIVYDPSWSPVQEERLLKELLTQIVALPYQIMDVDVSFVRGWVVTYYTILHNFHDWRVKMKIVVDEVETRLMNQPTPNEQFIQALIGVLAVGSIALSIIFEPFDWAMSIIDMARGDFSGAILNLIPLIPGALAKVGRFISNAIQTPAALAAKITGKLKKVDNALKELDEVMSAASVLNVNSTGVDVFDNVTIGKSPALEKGFKARMNKLGVHVEYFPGFLIPELWEVEAKAVLSPTGQIIVRLRDDTRIPALLHEDIHVQQYIRWQPIFMELLKKGDVEPLSKQALNYIKHYMELDAYKFEFKFAKVFGFSDEYIATLREFYHQSYEIVKSTEFEELKKLNPDFARIINTIGEHQ
jgi:hypothetical protein